MNAKLGGEPWAVKILMKNTMVIGYDTYHNTLIKLHERVASMPVAGEPSAQGSDVFHQTGCFSDECQAGRQTLGG